MPVGEASPKCLNTFLKNSFTAIGLSNWLLQSHFIPLWLKKTILFCISIMLAWRYITSVWSVLQLFAIKHICRMNFGFVYERAYVIMYRWTLGIIWFLSPYINWIITLFSCCIKNHLKFEIVSHKQKLFKTTRGTLSTKSYEVKQGIFVVLLSASSR